MLPHFRARRCCKSPTPRHKALLIGINYASTADDNEQGYRQLKGPINDAKEVKEALIGEAQPPLSRSPAQRAVTTLRSL